MVVYDLTWITTRKHNAIEFTADQERWSANGCLIKTHENIILTEKITMKRLFFAKKRAKNLSFRENFFLGF